MKRCVKWLVAVILCLTALAIPALASEVTLVELNSKQNIIIAVSYDKEEPSVVIKSPSGKSYSSDSDYDAVERGESAVYLYIRDAERGAWTIDCDKKSNTSVNATVLPWADDLTIDSLKVESQEGSTLTVSARVNCDTQRRFDYYLYAVVLDADQNASDSRLIARGSSSTGRDFSIKADTSALPDGEYHLELEAVYTTSEDVEVPTFFITDSVFTVKGNNSSGKAEQLVSELDLSSGTLTLDWSESENEVTSWTLELNTENADAEGNKQYYYAEHTPDITADSILLDRDLGDVIIKLTGVLKKSGYITYEKKVTWDNGVTVTFDTPELTNYYNALISYDTGEHTLRAVVTLNGSSEEFRLSGKSSISLTLSDMEVNEISIRYSYEDGSYYLTSQRVTVDSVPPSIDLYGISDRIYTSDSSITISGKTEASAVLTINGEEQDLDEDGSFIATLSLLKGQNNIVLEAQDAAGNKISRTFTADYTDTPGTPSVEKGSNIPWLLILALGGTLFSLLMLFIFGKLCNARLKKHHIDKFVFVHKLLAVLEGCFAGLCGASVGVAVYFILRSDSLNKSISGSNLVSTLENRTVAEIAKLLEVIHDYKTYFIIFLVAAAALLAICIGLIILDRALIKRQLRFICPSCGEKVDGKTKFCASCGAETRSSGKKTKDKKPKEKKPKDKEPKDKKPEDKKE